MAHYNLGIALYAKGDLDGAIAAYREAIRLDPNHAKAHGALGQALLLQGQFAEAKAASQKAPGVAAEESPPPQSRSATDPKL